LSRAAPISPPAVSSDLVEIWTDGSCRPNPGPGGWAALLRYRGHEREISGAEAESTNNRMELTAACAALEALKRPSRVRLHTDSEYLKKGITEWLPAWQRRGWRTAAGEKVANQELWERLLAAAAPHQIEWRWIKGHAGTAENERVDRLANAAREALARQGREG
jgi:ribonuclease HI